MNRKAKRDRIARQEGVSMNRSKSYGRMVGRIQLLYATKKALRTQNEFAELFKLDSAALTQDRFSTHQILDDFDRLKTCPTTTC